MPKDKKYKPKAKPMPYIEDAMEEFKMKPMPYIEGSIEEPRMKPMPYYEDDDMGLEAAAQGAARGAAGEAVAGSALTEIEKNRLKDAMPDYASGGEVVVGKGKDYIKDLL